MKRIAAIIGLMLVLMSGGANAALYSRAGGTMVYDDAFNITWIANMGLAAAQPDLGASLGGGRSWQAAQAWAENLTFGGFSDWRLPALDQSDLTCNESGPQSANGGPLPAGIVTFRYGETCTGSELSHLFAVDFGNMFSQRYGGGATAEQIANLGLFSNVEPGFYWSSSEVVWSTYVEPGKFMEAWAFVTYFSKVIYQFKDYNYYPVVVRDGDVANVPTPTTIALLGLGLAIIGAARRKQARPIR